MSLIVGILIPLVGTSLGSAMVFFMKDKINNIMEKILLGFASGVMMAAAVFSLILPAMEMAEDDGMGKLSFLPAAIGIALGIAALLIVDNLVPHQHLNSDEPEGLKAQLKKTTMLILAVTIHNFPEGMAVGAVFAGFLSDNAKITFAAALALSVGIAIQNFPEGAIISMPLKSEGMSKGKAFLYGTLSGVVEPIGAVLVIFLESLMIPILPYLLSFAAGAMIYVIVEELIPEASSGEHSNAATIGFSIGFIIMMVLDVALS
ncbi:MAG: ZIP family metal transporter [Lachnospiraceae bacterium]|nr:ZIP family metal transporter [Lachnospiraceae bacterium]